MGWLFYVCWGLIVAKMIISFCDDGVRLSNIIFGILLGSLLHYVLAALIILFLNIVHLGQKDKWKDIEYEKTEELVQINVGNSISGSFFLGCGNIDGKIVYTYYAKTSDNSYQLKQIVSDGCGIYEDDSVIPCIKYVNGYVNPNYEPSFLTRIYFGKKSKKLNLATPFIAEANIFIPKNTIVTNFSGINLDK